MHKYGGMARPWTAVLLAGAMVVGACAGSDAEEAHTRTRLTKTPATTLPPTTTAPTTTVPVEAVAQVQAPRPAATEARLSSLPGDAEPSTPASGSTPKSIGRLQIPSIGLDTPIFEGVDLAILRYGPGHWPGTAMPGEKGNSVFPGHRTTNTRPFWDIDRVRLGDEIIYTTAQGRFTYRATEILVVDERATWIASPTPGATTTIFGCHPKGSARQRYVVKGALASSGAAPAATPTTEPAPPTTAPPDLLGGLVPPGLFG